MTTRLMEILDRDAAIMRAKMAGSGRPLMAKRSKLGS